MSPLEPIKKRVPWWGRIAAKIVLSRLPGGYRRWGRWGVVRHGAMDDPAYAERIFRYHFDRVGSELPARGFVALELGPGDSVASALIARALGAARTYLVDGGDFAVRELDAYRPLLDHLAAQGLAVEEMAAAGDFPDLLERAGGVYLTGGLASLAEVPAGTVHFTFSNAVLEHVRKGELAPTLAALRRAMHEEGVASHQIDLRDHLGGALNHLRFSERFWESEFAARSWFYTNRVGYRAMLAAIRAAGFSCEAAVLARWPALPTPRARLAPAFRALPEDELLIQVFDVTLRPALGGGSAGLTR